MLSFYSLVLFSLFSLASATGHLLLELTASDKFFLQLRTNSSSQTLYMGTGDTRVVSFHPQTDLEFIAVSFSKRGKMPQHHVFSMKSSGNYVTDTFVLHDIVLLVQSVFECDAGFIGDDCREMSTTTSTTTTTTTSTTTTEVITTTTAKPTPAIQYSTGTASKMIDERNSNFNIILCVALIFFIIVLLVLIIIVFIALRKGQPNIYIQPQTVLPKQSVQIEMNESGIYSQDSQQSSSPASSNCSVVIKL
ncbi:unnamed protein product [Caenorhabditis brenneri]